MSFFRGLFAVVAMLGVAIFSTGAFAAVPLTITHEGRLLDATDKPVDGFFDITYRIFEVPTGGSPLWTEVHPSVPVADGLFSALLGSTVPLSADVLGNGGGGGGGGALSPRYLEVSVGGTALSPRLTLSSVPSAISSGHVSGDIETAPGQFTVTNNGSMTSGRLRVLTTSDSAVLVMDHDSNGDGVPETSLSSSCDASSASEVMEKKGLNAVNVKLARMISSPPGGDVATDALDMDSDDDGVMDKSISSSCDATGARLKVNNIGSSGEDGVELLALPTGSSVAIKEKGTGADRNRITGTTNPEAATVLLEADLDGDGVMDNTSADSVGTGGASRRLEVHNIGSSGQDGVSVDLRCSPDSAAESTELRRNGAIVSADYDRHTPFHNSHISSFFDVFTEMSIEDVCDSTGALRRLESHNIGSSGNDGVEVQMRARPKGGIVKVTATQNSQSLRCSSSADTAAATMLVEADLDGDGVPDNSVLSISDATSARMAIKTKGTGASNARMVSVSSGTADSAGVVACDVDDNGNGIPEYRAVLTVTDEDGDMGSDMRCVADTDDDGVPDNDASLHVTPTTSSVAIKTKGTGADKDRTASVSSNTSLSSASVACDVDLDGDGVSDNSVSQSCGTAGAELALSEGDAHVALGTRKGGMVKGAINITNGSVLKVQLDSDGTGFFASKVGIGVITPTEAISVAGGAYCDGTNWVNASDRNSKENFTAVDGNELLDQIAQLSITRWNYKGNNQAEHIGPTAQDFKAAFGVGADDKSISTIDPSGIALAAIKALNSKMQELDAKTNEINQLKAELDAIKAMLQKQAVTKN